MFITSLAQWRHSKWNFTSFRQPEQPSRQRAHLQWRHTAPNGTDSTKVLLLNEPFGALDAKDRGECHVRCEAHIHVTVTCGIAWHITVINLQLLIMTTCYLGVMNDLWPGGAPLPMPWQRIRRCPETASGARIYRQTRRRWNWIMKRKFMSTTGWWCEKIGMTALKLDHGTNSWALLDCNRHGWVESGSWKNNYEHCWMVTGMSGLE